MAEKLNPLEPDVFGPFKLHRPPEGMQGFTLSWEGEWLPGLYADKEALMLVCGLFLGSSNEGLVDEFLETLQKRYNQASPSQMITAELVLKHWRPNNSG